MSPIQYLFVLSTGVWIPPVGMHKVIEPAQRRPAIVKLDAAQAEPKRFHGSFRRQADPRFARIHRQTQAQALAEATLAESGGPSGGIAISQAGSSSNEQADIQAGGPWLGVQFGPVPKLLAKHLNLEEGVGQLVLNVAEGSPADQAGLEQYDVITQFDGDHAPGEIEPFMEIVRTLQPGETKTLRLIRAGKQTEAVVTIGQRPARWDELKYKYESEEEELLQDSISRSGGILRKDDQGNWTYNGFDPKLMPDVWNILPDEDGATFQFRNFAWAPQSGSQDITHTSKGKTIRVRRDANGQISVTRTELENGRETTTTKSYSNEDEFRKQDAEAAELLGQQVQAALAPRAWRQHIPKDFDAQIHEAMKRCEEVLRQSDGIQRGYDQAMKQLEERLAAPGFPGSMKRAARSRTSFEVQTDGSIRVTTREGGEELVETFADADAMKTASPDLYARFEKLQAKHKDDAGSKDKAQPEEESSKP